MVNFFKNIILWTLKIAVVGLVIALFLFVFWWFNLPLLAIIIIVCSIAALIVMFFTVRQLRIWYDKRLYVKTVLTQNEKILGSSTKTVSEMLMAWNRGMEVFTHSPATAAEVSALYRQSWTLLLGRNSHENQSFISSLTGDTSTKKSIDEPLHWHFLTDMVLLEPNSSLLNTQDPSSQRQWEEFLAQIAKHRTNEPINALVITINAKDLYAYDAQEDGKVGNIHNNPALDTSQIADLREYGSTIRARIGQVLAVSSAKLPVYILVSEINALRGMFNLPAHLTANMQKKLLGACFDIASDTKYTYKSSAQTEQKCSIPFLIQQALLNATNDIQTFIVDEAVRENFPVKDELYALSLFQRLEEGLNVFLESLLRATPYGISPLLRSISFTCSDEAYENIVSLDKNSLKSKNTPQDTNFSVVGNIPGDMSTSPISVSLMPNSTSLVMPFAEQNTKEPSSNVSDHKGISKNPTPNFINKVRQACFISELFTQIIPADRSLYQPLNKFAGKTVWIISGFVVYYLLLFMFCATLAVNTIYTTYTIDEYAGIIIPENVDNSIPQGFLSLQQHYKRIQLLKKAQNIWIFHFLGQNRLALEQKKEEESFVLIMQEKVFPALLSRITQSTTPSKNRIDVNLQSEREITNAEKMLVPMSVDKSNLQSDNIQVFENLQKLIWLQEAVSLRIKDGTSKGMRSKPFPQVNYFNEHSNMWNVHSGELFLLFIDISPEESLYSLQTYLNLAVKHVLSSPNANFFAYMESIVNTEMPAAAISISLFWPNVPSGSPNYIEVPALYTADGFKRMQSIMTTFFDFNKEEGEILENNKHWQLYQRNYIRIWKQFALRADDSWMHVTRISTLRDMIDISQSKKSQYVRVLSTMSKNLEPLRNSSVAPKWVHEVLLLNALVEIASLTAEENPSSLLVTPGIILDIFQSSTSTLEILQKELIKEHNPAKIVNAVSSLSTYFFELQEVKYTTTSADGSLELARLQFGGKDYGDIEKSSFTLATKALTDALSSLNISSDVIAEASKVSLINDHIDSPGIFLLQGPYRFLAHVISSIAAQELQKIWDSSVMSEAILLPVETAMQMLFEEQGVATTFVDTQAMPFLSRKINHYEANSFVGVVFPFTPDFLEFIQQGQSVALVKPKDSYDVQLISQPPSLNIGAKEYLQYLEVSLNCQEKTYTLRNSNYPENAVFPYDPKICTDVTLKFKFPSLTLQYTYPDFASFLYDFSYGERVFEKADFPENDNSLENLGVSSIHARILPKNTSALLSKLDIVLLPLPAKICGVW